MIRNVEFRSNSNTFLDKLKVDIERIKSSDNMLVFADKTTNIYEIDRDTYNKLLHDNITKSYQKANIAVKKKIDNETKAFEKRLDLDKKMEQFADRQAFITLKDHKDNFKNKLPCRLINPAKSEIGIVAKRYLETINNSLADSSHLNQWRDTSTVINWFKNLENKSNARFIKFDIVDFYPSISEGLLDNAINYA